MSTPNYNLRAIYVRSSTLSMEDDFDPTIGGQQLSGQFRSHVRAYVFRESSVTEPDGTQRTIHSHDFTTAFAFRYQTARTNEKGEVALKTAASIEVDFVSSYELVGSIQPSQEELEEFGRTAALIHVWPYFREYCSSMLQKMHLPGTLIPLLEVKSGVDTKKTTKKSIGTVIESAKRPGAKRKTAVPKSLVNKGKQQ